jgi:hypothetical protein
MCLRDKSRRGKLVGKSWGPRVLSLARGEALRRWCAVNVEDGPLGRSAACGGANGGRSGRTCEGVAARDEVHGGAGVLS